MYKDEHGHTYIAVIKENCTKAEAVKVANNHLKTKKDNLVVQSGKLNGETLMIGVRGDLWVVSRRAKV